MTKRGPGLLQRAQYAPVAAIWAGLAALGPRRASATAGAVARAIGPRLSFLSDRARANLRLIFPEWSAAEIDAVVAAMWENLGRTFGEYPHLPAIMADPENIAFEMHPEAERIVTQGPPAIFVTGHFANWEAPASLAARMPNGLAIVYRRQNNRALDAAIARLRERASGALFIPKGRGHMRALVGTLESGRHLAILADQKLNSGGVLAPFLGRDAMSPPAAARLALRYQRPVLPGAIFRLAGGRFRAVLEAPIAFTPSGRKADDIRMLTTLINERLSDFIRRDPAGWLWLHRRWRIKTPIGGQALLPREEPGEDRPASPST